MKKLVVLLSLVATVSAFSQGTVAFSTKNTTVGSVVNAPVDYGAGGPVTAATKPWTGLSIASGALTFGANAQAGLYGGAAGTAENALTLLTPAVPFRSTSGAAGYVNAGIDNARSVAGVAFGAQATFQIRAWDTGNSSVSTYEDALALLNHQEFYAGKGNVFTIATGGGSVAPTFLVPAAGFTMTYFPVPEPSIIGLGILGAVAGLIAFRRRN